MCPRFLTWIAKIEIMRTPKQKWPLWPKKKPRYRKEGLDCPLKSGYLSGSYVQYSWIINNNLISIQARSKLSRWKLYFESNLVCERCVQIFDFCSVLFFSSLPFITFAQINLNIPIVDKNAAFTVCVHTKHLLYLLILDGCVKHAFAMFGLALTVATSWQRNTAHRIPMCVQRSAKPRQSKRYHTAGVCVSLSLSLLAGVNINRHKPYSHSTGVRTNRKTPTKTLAAHRASTVVRTGKTKCSTRRLSVKLKATGIHSQPEWVR